MQSKIISVSAIAGGGKTTLVRQLVEAYDDAVGIHFDDYATNETYPTNLPQWLDDGADFDQFRVPRLAEDLGKLKAGQAVTNPQGKLIEPAAHIFFEAPLGRSHTATGQQIDFAVFIDTPLEIGLARFVLRALDSADDSYTMPLQTYIASYLPILRPLYLAQRTQLLPQSDLVLDGEQMVSSWVERVASALAAT